jgi:hypothetical protein
MAFFKTVHSGCTQLDHDIVNLFSEKNNILAEFDCTPIHIAVLGMYDPKDTERPTLEE